MIQDKRIFIEIIRITQPAQAVHKGIQAAREACRCEREPLIFAGGASVHLHEAVNLSPEFNRLREMILYLDELLCEATTGNEELRLGISDAFAYHGCETFHVKPSQQV